MRSRSVLILDDFYEDPLVMRNLALSLDFRPKDGAMYPGGEAYSDARDWEAVRQDIMQEIGIGNIENVPANKDFKQGKFRLALQQHEASRPDAVHQDVQRYSGIVYLANNENCRGGVGLYQCKLTGETAMSRIWINALGKHFDVSINDSRFASLMRAYCADWNNWNKIGELHMRFNRLIVLMARCFHASTGIFGEAPETGRLTQHFEMYL